MRNDDDTDTITKPRGRPSADAGPSFPPEEVDQLLVHGEVEELEGGGTTWHYPSYREIGERFGVSHSLIARYSQNHNCLKRREQVAKRAREKADTKLIELRAEQITLGRKDNIRCIDRYMVQFEEALKEGKVRCNTVADFNMMVRLKSFLLGDADSRHEELGGITLEDMQAAHARLLKAEEQMRLNPALTGMVYPEPAMMRGGKFGDDDDDDGDDGSDGGSPMLN